MQPTLPRFVWTLFSPVLASVLAGCDGPTVLHDVLIRGVTVVDVQSGELRPDQTIAIDDTLITFIGVDASGSRAGRAEVDGAGRYAIPGLWDMHVHIEGTDLVEDNRLLLPVYLAQGVTTVRDMASDLGEQVLAWRDSINAHRIAGPRIYTAGRKIEGMNSVWKDDLEVADYDEMLGMMDRLDAYGVDFVKVTENTLEADLFLATVQEARRRGYRVSGHVPYGTTVAEVARTGISSIEHASHMIRMGSVDEEAVAARVHRKVTTKGEAQAHYDGSFDQDQARRGYARLAELGTYVTPTLIGSRQLAFLDEDPHEEDDFQRYLTKAFMSPYASRAQRASRNTPEDWAAAKSRYRRTAAQVLELQEAGVTLLGGSDSAPIAAYVYPGRAIHDEIRIFQEAGLSPLQALQTVTVNGARFLGQAEVAGTLSPGKLADVVILRENPMLDIGATTSVDAVVARGRIFDRAALDALLDEAAEAASALDSARGDTG